MSQSQPQPFQEPAGAVDGYSAMVESMRECRATEYERARVLAMAKQHSRYEERLAAEAAARAVRVRLAVPVVQARLEPTPETAWDLVHYRGMSTRDAANRLGVKPPTVLELLADYRAVAEEQELKAIRAIDVATAAGNGR
jgi:DNA-directed RNA polymerase specialized sigma24 family protein